MQKSNFQDIQAFLSNESFVTNADINPNYLKSDMFSQAKELRIVYSDKSNVIKKVVISDWSQDYSLANNFSRIAHKEHFSLPPKSADFVPFLSFMPQYSDLNKQQYDFYLYWRENVRNSNFIPTDSAYIFLYIYEIIALDDIIPPDQALEKLIRLWEAYYVRHSRIGKYLCDWIVDYALIHNIRIPFDKLRTFLPFAPSKQQSILLNMFLFDYMFSKTRGLTIDDLHLICDALSNYSPFKSKHYSVKEYRNAFDSSLKPIFESLLNIDYFFGEKSTFPTSELKITRPSYLGALCSHDTKKKLIITYYPYISNELIRTSFSNIIKHTENKLRVAFGIKNRLPGTVLPKDIMHIIDMNINKFCKRNDVSLSDKVTQNSKAKTIKKVRVDIAAAKEIEDISWQTTQKLTEGLYDQQDIVTEQPTSTQDCQSGDSFETMLSDTEKDVLKMMLDNTSTADIEAFVRKSGQMLDAVVGSINEKALEHIGDTIILADEYSIIPDYIEELSSFSQE